MAEFHCFDDFGFFIVGRFICRRERRAAPYEVWVDFEHKKPDGNRRAGLLSDAVCDDFGDIVIASPQVSEVASMLARTDRMAASWSAS